MTSVFLQGLGTSTQHIIGIPWGEPIPRSDRCWSGGVDQWREVGCCFAALGILESWSKMVEIWGVLGWFFAVQICADCHTKIATMFFCWARIQKGFGAKDLDIFGIQDTMRWSGCSNIHRTFPREPKDTCSCNLMFAFSCESRWSAAIKWLN